MLIPAVEGFHVEGLESNFLTLSMKSFFTSNFRGNRIASQNSAVEISDILPSSFFKPSNFGFSLNSEVGIHVEACVEPP